MALISVFLLGTIGSVAYGYFMKQQANDYTFKMIEQVSKNIDYQIAAVENVLKYLAKDENVIEFAKSRIDRDDISIEKMEKISDTFHSFYQTNPYISGILMVNSAGKYFSNEMLIRSNEPVTSEEWFINAILQSEPRLRFFSKMDERRIIYKQNISAFDKATITYPIIDPTSDHNIGVILVDINLFDIKQQINETKFGKNGFVYIIDGNGDIIYTPVNKTVYRIDNSWFNENNKMINQTIQGEDYQLLYERSNYNNITTVGVFSLNEALSSVETVEKYFIAIGLFTILIGVILSFVFAYTIERPLSKLTGLMKNVEDGDLTVKFNSQYDDEIGKLGNSFNKMISKINSLISMVYKEQKSKREAELRILHEQIKPHFLYNTLDTIRWLAQKHNVLEIEDIVSELSNFFRIGLNNGDELIELKEEINHITSYLAIQKVRYKDKLSYFIECDEVEDLFVLKTILQPIIENAIYHGIRNKEMGGNILITSRKDEEAVIFEITDDGVGMSEERLEEIAKRLSGKEKDGVGFGIYNVSERIKLTFGDEYGISIYSTVDAGTTIQIRHPKLQEKKVK